MGKASSPALLVISLSVQLFSGCAREMEAVDFTPLELSDWKIATPEQTGLTTRWWSSSTPMPPD